MRSNYMSEVGPRMRNIGDNKFKPGGHFVVTAQLTHFISLTHDDREEMVIFLQLESYFEEVSDVHASMLTLQAAG